MADAYRIKDRGRIAPGAWADLLLFDPSTVARGPKRRVSDGVRAVDQRGVISGCGRPGRVLRAFAS